MQIVLFAVEKNVKLQCCCTLNLEQFFFNIPIYILHNVSFLGYNNDLSGVPFYFCVFLK